MPLRVRPIRSVRKGGCPQTAENFVRLCNRPGCLGLDGIVDSGVAGPAGSGVRSEAPDGRRECGDVARGQAGMADGGGAAMSESQGSQRAGPASNARMGGAKGLFRAVEFHGPARSVAVETGEAFRKRYGQ